MFQVTTLDLDKVKDSGKVDYSKDNLTKYETEECIMRTVYTVDASHQLL